MAQAVKNSTRRRRPPSHFHQGYNQENLETGNNPYYGTRDQTKQGSDPYSLPTMARLLAKFVNTANKKMMQVPKKKNQQEIAQPQKKQPISESKNNAKTEPKAKQQRPATTFKTKEGSESRQTSNRQQHLRTHQKNSKKAPNSIPPTINIQQKAGKNQLQVIQSSQKNRSNIPTDSIINNIESMARMNREQLLKLMSKPTVDPNIIRQQFLSVSDPQSLRNVGKYSQNLYKQSMKSNQFRQDSSKLFKRASFHIGIAYSIHIQNVKKKNPNFTPQDLDPTFVSRRLKQQNVNPQSKKATQQRQKISKHEQALLRQRQQQHAMQANRIRNIHHNHPHHAYHHSNQFPFQYQTYDKKAVSQQIKGTPSKEPICIDLQDDEEDDKDKGAQRKMEDAFKSSDNSGFKGKSGSDSGQGAGIADGLPQNGKGQQINEQRQSKQIKQSKNNRQNIGQKQNPEAQQESNKIISQQVINSEIMPKQQKRLQRQIQIQNKNQNKQENQNKIQRQQGLQLVGNPQKQDFQLQNCGQNKIQKTQNLVKGQNQKKEMEEQNDQHENANNVDQIVVHRKQ